MTSVSYGLDAEENQQPENVHTGTLAVSTYNVEVRIDKTANLTTERVALILDAIKRRILDSGSVELGQV